MFRARLSLAVVLLAMPLLAQDVTLDAIVTPSSTIVKNGGSVTFAIHGFVEFRTLAELFPYIDAQTRRWKLTPDERRDLARNLLRRGIESRIVSMADERPLEVLVTHTADELRHALGKVKEPVPENYATEFLAVQDKWKHSLNCWSASPVIAARVLSNFYPISEGIELYGARYDSTEHFWQAVKYHPETTVAGINDLLDAFDHKDWAPWLKRLDDDPRLYLPNAYAVEFLRYNLTTARRQWFRAELKRRARDTDRLRALQQRGSNAFRFTALEEKTVWGDLADLMHLVYTFSPSSDPIRKTLEMRGFDGIYLDGKKMSYIGGEFRSLMLEIWKVKFLKMPRFGEVLRGIPASIKLEHFLNDPDSPDIPLAVYVRYLAEIRELARGAR